MLLIVSDEIDQTTNTVIDWLIQKDVEYIRVNSNAFLSSTFIKISNDVVNVVFEFDGMRKQLAISEITSFWYRKGDFSIDFLRFLPEGEKELKKIIYEHLLDEWTTVKSFFFEILSQKKKTLGNYSEHISNKLSYLMLARKHGFLIPETYVCNQTVKLQEIFHANSNLITKSAQEIFNAVYQGNNLYTYTDSVSKEDIQNLPNTFFPSLVQQNIKKKYELRVFFMNNEFYSMAIFSQRDIKTQIDFRNYNYENPNRTVPYKLPTEIKEKLSRFVVDAKLNSGSIDMIVNPEGEFIFLEVNPSGQFGFLSYDCNYYLEKKVADYLT